jgi:hypothetical protein
LNSHHTRVIERKDSRTLLELDSPNPLFLLFLKKKKDAEGRSKDH